MLVCVDLLIKGLVWDIVDIRLDVRLRGLKTQGREMFESGWTDIFKWVSTPSDPVAKNKPFHLKQNPAKFQTSSTGSKGLKE